jgi:hypothetical protein
MSFDQEFNYTSIINFLNTQFIEKYNLEINESNAQLSQLQNLPSQYASLMGERIDYYTRNISYLSTSISRLTNVINEINKVQNISNENKQLLYQFYTTFVNTNNSVTKRVHWMRQMIYHTDQMLTHIANVICEETTENCAIIVSQMICDEFEPCKETSSFTDVLMKEFRVNENI